MKREKIVYAFLLLLVFSGYFIYAEENSSLKFTSDPEQIKEDITSTGQEATSTFKEKLADQREIPEEIKWIPELLFGISDSISVSQLIIYSAVWILILLILNNLVSFLPFNINGISWIMSGIIMLLMGLGGGITLVTNVWMSVIEDIFSTVTEPNSWTISIGIIVLTIFFVITKYFLRTVKEAAKIAQASIEGAKAGYGASILKATGEAVNEAGKK